jgi:GTP-binding protein
MFKLQGTPLRVQFKKTGNPFEGKEPPKLNRRGNK